MPGSPTKPFFFSFVFKPNIIFRLSFPRSGSWNTDLNASNLFGGDPRKRTEGLGHADGEQVRRSAQRQDVDTRVPGLAPWAPLAVSSVASELIQGVGMSKSFGCTSLSPFLKSLLVIRHMSLPQPRDGAKNSVSVTSLPTRVGSVFTCPNGVQS